jgi:chromosome segregation ATPase
VLRFTTAALITLALSLGCSSADKKSAELEKQLQAGDTALIRDRDNLGTAVAEYASMVNELDSVLRTPSGRSGKAGDVVDERERRRDILLRARELRHSLDSMGARIQQLEGQARRLGAANQSKLADIAALKATVAQLNEISNRQVAEIARMGLQYDSLSQVSQANARNAASLQAALNEKVEQQESVFVAVGSANELTRLGVIRKRGGVIGIGSTITPNLPFKQALFKPLRMSADTVIELPKPSATYRVVTSQNAAGAGGAALHRLSGKLVIHDPKLFWRDARYLIIVER